MVEGGTVYARRFEKRIKGRPTVPVRMALGALIIRSENRRTDQKESVPVGLLRPTVSQILGHSSVWFTYDTYVHLLPEMQREAAETQMQLINSPKM